MSRQAAVVTGLGAVTPLGGDVATTWQAMLAGQSGVRLLEEDWAADLPVRIAARAAVDPVEVLGRVPARTLDRSAQFALIAAREAWADAGLTDAEPERVAVVVASGIGGVTTLLSQYDVLKEKGPRRVSPFTVPMLLPNTPAATISIEIGAKAGVHTTVSACASGAEAVAMALELIRDGRADVVLCGGTEAAIHALPMAAFASMKAMSSRNDDPAAASRPYDKARDGFVMGEGAGILVLESTAHAARRGARIHGQILGAGLSADAHHITAPDPTGAGAARAMQFALDDAGVQPGDVVHVNAHATSTPLGDVAEAGAIATVLGEATAGAAVTSTKSMTGHLLGAAGALETIAALLALREGLAPPTRNLDDPDDGLPVDVVRGEARKLEGSRDGRPTVALNNAFGFGGHNVALVVGAPPVRAEAH